MFVQVAAWERFSWLRHGFSTRAGGVSKVYGDGGGLSKGSLNLGWTKEDDPRHVLENRRRFAQAVAGESARAITVRQVHGTVTHTICSGDGPFETPEGRAVLEGDGLMTDRPGVLLGIQTADCVPVMVADTRRRAVAVFHAGWRGTVAGIVQKGVEQMRTTYGSDPEDLVAAVGPSIGACCYTVGEEVRDGFKTHYGYADALFGEREGQLTVDLWEANRRQLLDAGVEAGKITVIGECSGCAVDQSGERKYFSHRIDRGVTGRMMSLIAVVEGD